MPSHLLSSTNTVSLSEALSILSQTRQTTILSSFLTALTRGVGVRGPRPIELHAHDPLRYIGDMLAWVHQSIAAEREFLEALFDMQGDGRMVGSVRVFSRGKEKVSKEEDWVEELMDLAVGKLCVPLKVSICLLNICCQTDRQKSGPRTTDCPVAGE